MLSMATEGTLTGKTTHDRAARRVTAAVIEMATTIAIEEGREPDAALIDECMREYRAQCDAFVTEYLNDAELQRETHQLVLREAYRRIRERHATEVAA